eukprot:m.182610 g.182610  ORF g.182610 m.182610 type:complete len:341 (-) comp15530_c0_seq2:78-1100(-)
MFCSQHVYKRILACIILVIALFVMNMWYNNMAAAEVGSAIITKQDQPQRACEKPLIVLGLWILPNNKKHGPKFFISRLSKTLVSLGASQYTTLLFAGGEEHSKGGLSQQRATASYISKSRSNSVFVYQHVDVDDLPYKNLAKAAMPTCPTKYGKPIPSGQLQVLNKVWLSKIHLLWNASRGAGLNGQNCNHNQWLWLDAGLNDKEVSRVLAHVKYKKAPQSGKIHIQHYCEEKSLPEERYFNGLCPIKHKLNAKAIWADGEAIANLLTVFNECLHALAFRVGSFFVDPLEVAANAQHKQSTCVCFDEETVLTHIFLGRAPCAKLNSPTPEFVELPVLSEC